MKEDYRIEPVDKIEGEMWGAIGGGIHEYNEQEGGPSNGQQLCFILYGPDEEIAGGVIGETHWDWLYVNLMWMREELRGRGYGRRLLTLAEEEARQRGAKDAYLDTFSFQAPGFYGKYGYEVFGELADFPAGHTRYYMRKTL